MSMTVFAVDGMSCDKCAARVIKAVKALAPEADVQVDLARKSVTVAPGGDAAAIARAITDAGYPARAA